MFHLVKILFVGFINKTSSAAILSAVFFPCTVFGVEIARKLGEAKCCPLLETWRVKEMFDSADWVLGLI